jgi:hypothetical protein
MRADCETNPISPLFPVRRFTKGFGRSEGERFGPALQTVPQGRDSRTRETWIPRLEEIASDSRESRSRMARHETRHFTWTTNYDDVVGVVNNQQLAEAAHREKTQPFAKYSTLKPRTTKSKGRSSSGYCWIWPISNATAYAEFLRNSFSPGSLGPQRLNQL